MLTTRLDPKQPIHVYSIGHAYSTDQNCRVHMSA